MELTCLRWCTGRPVVNITVTDGSSVLSLDSVLIQYCSVWNYCVRRNAAWHWVEVINSAVDVMSVSVITLYGAISCCHLHCLAQWMLQAAWYYRTVSFTTRCRQVRGRQPTVATVIDEYFALWCMRGLSLWRSKHLKKNYKLTWAVCFFGNNNIQRLGIVCE